MDSIMEDRNRLEAPFWLRIVHLFNGLKGNGCPLSVLRQRLLMETQLPWHATIYMSHYILYMYYRSPEQEKFYLTLTKRINFVAIWVFTIPGYS